MRQRTDRGDSLIEIVITVVIIGITVSALLLSLGATGTSAQFQRTTVETDTVMRNYAEAIKLAAPACDETTVSDTPGLEPPTGFTVSATPEGGVCTLTITGPNTQTMQIVIRTP